MADSAYYGDEDLQRALPMYEKAAGYGDPEAQYTLAGLYLDGEGVPQDTRRGMQLLEDAALQGYSPAERMLGLAYMGTQYADLDLSRAESYLLSAARKNDVFAMVALGRLYSAYRETQDFDAAARWYAAARRLEPSLDPQLESPQYISEHVILVKQDKPLEGKTLVAEVQKMLGELGYSPGLADGIAGNRTVRAVKKFQTDSGMEADGKIDNDLLSSLRKAEREK